MWQLVRFRPHAKGGLTEQILDLFDLTIRTAHVLTSIFVMDLSFAEWFRVEGDKIVELKTFFDSRKFMPPGRRAGTETMAANPQRKGAGSGPYFSPKGVQFLRELKANNNRGWFEANRDRYEADVKEPMLHFIVDLADHLRAVSPHFKVDPRPVGGSMFRIHRDIRFSKDKSPYKTNVGAHFPHRSVDKHVNAPGFYVHLEPGNSIGGGGLWHPEAADLKKVRDRIVGRPSEWKVIRKSGIIIEGDSLKRVPPGYDPEHPYAEDLKRKDFYLLAKFSEREVCAPDFMDRFVEVCRSATPLMEFLTRAMGLPWLRG